MPIETLRLGIAQRSHARKLPFHPTPGLRLLNQLAPVEQAARNQIADTGSQRAEHQASSGQLNSNTRATSAACQEAAAMPSDAPLKRPKRLTPSKKPVR